MNAFHEMTGRNNRSYVCIGGADFNCQLGCVGVSPEGIDKVKDLVKLKELEKSMAFLPSKV